jgi:hypothetical protein
MLMVDKVERCIMAIWGVVGLILCSRDRSFGGTKSIGVDLLE